MIKPFNQHIVLKQHKSLAFGELNKNQVEIFNVQGGFPVNKSGVAENPIAYQGEVGGSCWGGQLTYTNSAAAALKEFTDTDKVFVAGQKFNIPERAVQPFGKDYEVANNGVAYVRQSLTDQNKYIDKEETSKDGNKNVFYETLTKPYIEKIQETIQTKTGKKGVYAGNVIGGYIDGYLAIRHNDDVLKDKKEKNMPHNVWILHSAGGPKFKNMLIKRAKANLVNHIANAKEKSPRKITESIVKRYANELLNDHKYEFPSRLLAEKIAFTDPTTKVVVNSPYEIKEQINAYPYKGETEGVNNIDPEKINVITPGVDKKRFLRSSETEGHINNAMKAFNKRYELDIPEKRRSLNNILTVGRLDEKKNFHGVINAFAESKKLRDKANLVLVINGKDSGVNYLEIAQSLFKQVNNNQISLKNAELRLKDNGISNTDYLMELGRIVNQNEDKLKGTITCISLPNANEFGGLHIGLGEEGKTIGGLNSTQEPYGLVPAEQNLAGIPGPVAKTAGVYAELEKDNLTPGFDPNDPNDIANAYIKMIDNKDKYAKSLKDWAEGKTWESWCNKVLNLAKKGDDISFKEVKEKHPVIYSNPIDYTSKEFVNKGKDMVLKATEEELAKGKEGAFNTVFEEVETLLNKKVTQDATIYSNVVNAFPLGRTKSIPTSA